MVAVPFRLPVKVSPAGSSPDSVMAGTGCPAALMVRCRGMPTLAVITGIFVMVGALLTVRVNAWVAVPAEFVALSLSD
jgi:hypothetical protein